ncbi:hypothetical protein TPHA_0D03230 [Tetrapisispora phaffii CBS 4417]|uniref:CCAAT-binding factor domain-containing protein n=1 Tax=Tetrapisispora phaffii (strain ATCC 24235 / CBS 4417 / NBRC 1672 / NRRL Y-8282 / UCD 70-5) TaxID=1071381 RepID=G8BSY8_TETPH|nr:hypothetical protein TPHA_0D03230 [Tetrapisispora phaffii CBS 4417]CCE62959.1 hypothetical protein TPHA_0D03230 [Tetrapisispora phaffii CBS 4417]
MSLTFEEIKRDAKSIISIDDKKNYKLIIPLINNLTIDENDLSSDEFWDENEQRLRFIVVSLFQVFKQLFSREDMTIRSAKTDETKQLRTWCRKLFENFKDKLLVILSSIPFETSIALDSLDVYMQCIELEAIYFSSNVDDPYFPTKTYQKLLVALWDSDFGDEELKNGQSQNATLVEFKDNYYQKFADVQFYFNSEFNKLLTDSNEDERYTSSNSIGKWLTVVNHDVHCDLPNNDDLEVYVANPPKLVEDVSKFKSNFEKNWLYILNGFLSVDQYKTILLILHKRIIPHFHTPTKLMDFLTDSYNVNFGKKEANSGIIPILSLNGLFELMRRFNLEYPNFYSKLYQCLTPDLMHVKYRSRFFRMLELFLSSTHISSHLVASFIKKLARLTLQAPPSAIVTVIPFTYNLLKKHPTCMIMLHNPAFIDDPFGSDEQKAELKRLKLAYNDPYDPEETNPELTNAIGSSLWELLTLVDHYHTNVASLAKIFAQPFRKLNYNMEDFLDWGYDSLLKAEVDRKLKVSPSLEYDTFDDIFANDTSRTEKGDVLGSDSIFIEGVDW